MNLTDLNEIVWNTNFWLPNGYSWQDLNKFNKYDFTLTILCPIYTAVGLFFIRILFEKTIGAQIATYFLFKERKKCEKATRLNGDYDRDNSKYIYREKVTKKTVNKQKVTNEKTSWNEYQKSIIKPRKLKKFTESLWRFVFYTSIWIYGFQVLYHKSWFWDTRECWQNHPKHSLSKDIYWYYTIELGFYFSLLATQFVDVKRKDFWQMFLHHVVTIALLLFSYFCNFIRVGSLVLLVHDCVDIWLELGKMGAYTRSHTFCNIFFILFAVTWFVTRLVIFPFKILYSTTIEAPSLIGTFPAYYLFNVLLYILQVMHVIWFYTICKMAYKALIKGNIEKDDRSETESECENESKNE